MPKDPSTVGIAPGDGLIARFGAVVVYLAGETSSTDRILGAIEAVADGEHPGAAIVQRLAAVVFGGGSEPPPFGVVAPTGDGTVILLRGPVSAEIQGAEGTRRLAGARAFTWVDEIVREPVRQISVGADTALPLTTHPRSNLRDGVVPGGGFVFRVAVRKTGKAARPAPAAPQSAAGDEPPPTAPAGMVALSESDTPSSHEARASAEIGTRAGPLAWSETSDATRPTTSSRPQPVALDKVPTQGGARPRRVRPTGSAPAPATSTLGPATGALVFEDGAAYPLDRPYVIGRSPMSDDSVRTAAASPIAVPRDRHVSRVHAYVSLERGKVYVRDASTPAGTFIAAPGAEQWTRVGTAPIELPPGWSVRIGERIATHRIEDRRKDATEISGERHARGLS
ncbi:FHA domain-containing protein [Nocardia sp. NBC_01009]|uniref:FHA domain-containing protein n=1 Tax=Nocardia sp. NBC_01009 TaxID=2975996 RepID=UPI00386631CF|nr:FHA domain-containing protein [Nocardia sp. NBC_01009]